MIHLSGAAAPRLSAMLFSSSLAASLLPSATAVSQECSASAKSLATLEDRHVERRDDGCQARARPLPLGGAGRGLGRECG